MLVSMLTNVTSYRFNSDEYAIRMIKEAGFEAFDIGLELTRKGWPLPFEYRIEVPDYKEKAAALRKLSQELEIPCCTSHGPCITGHENKEIYEHMLRQTIHSMEYAALVGAKAIVVHPIHIMNHQTHREEQMQLNVEMYRRLAAYARDFGIKVAAETLIEAGPTGALVPAGCGRAEEFCRIADVDPDWITVCLDIGHASCAGVDIPSLIRELGKERLYMLHVHDNDLKGDLHIMPYQGKVNFGEIIQALRDIQFDGVLDMEVDLGKFPNELFPDVAKLMCAVGKYMKAQIQA